MYNKRQKKLIRDLVQYDFENLKTIQGFLCDRVFTGDSEEKDIHILPKSNGKFIVFYKPEVERKALYYLFEVISLLNRFIKDGLILPIPANNNGFTYISSYEQLTISKSINGCQYFKSNNEDVGYLNLNDTCWYENEQILRYKGVVFDETQLPIREVVNICPIVGPELVDLVKQNFKTNEEKTLLWTRITAAISFVALIVALCFSNYSSTKIIEKQDASPKEFVISKEKNE